MSFPKPTIEDFKKRFAEFELTDPTKIQMALDDANDELYVALHTQDQDNIAKNCILYFAAHKLAMALRGIGNIEQIAPLSSKSTGGVSVSYQQGTISNIDLQFEGTQYGQEYLRLRRIFSVYALIV